MGHLTVVGADEAWYVSWRLVAWAQERDRDWRDTTGRRVKNAKMPKRFINMFFNKKTNFVKRKRENEEKWKKRANLEKHQKMKQKENIVQKKKAKERDVKKGKEQKVKHERKEEKNKERQRTNKNEHERKQEK